jgi:gas vesicle protein
MSNMFSWLCGFAAGAAVMYFMDPQRGRARRAMLRDKAYSLAHEAEEFAEKQARHLGNQAEGLMHETRKAVAGAVGGQGEQTGQRQQAAAR